MKHDSTQILGGRSYKFVEGNAKEGKTSGTGTKKQTAGCPVSGC